MVEKIYTSSAPYREAVYALGIELSQ